MWPLGWIWEDRTLRRWAIAARRITVHARRWRRVRGAWPEKIRSGEVRFLEADETGTLYSETVRRVAETPSLAKE